jgi:hypothetical protein
MTKGSNLSARDIALAGQLQDIFDLNGGFRAPTFEPGRTGLGRETDNWRPRSLHNKHTRTAKNWRDGRKLAASVLRFL